MKQKAAFRNLVSQFAYSLEKSSESDHRYKGWEVKQTPIWKLISNLYLMGTPGSNFLQAKIFCSQVILWNCYMKNIKLINTKVFNDKHFTLDSLFNNGIKVGTTKPCPMNDRGACVNSVPWLQPPTNHQPGQQRHWPIYWPDSVQSRCLAEKISPEDWQIQGEIRD